MESEIVVPSYDRRDSSLAKLMNDLHFYYLYLSIYNDIDSSQPFIIINVVGAYSNAIVRSKILR